MFNTLSTCPFHLPLSITKSRCWLWTSYCESDFLYLEGKLCSDWVLALYDKRLPLVLAGWIIVRYWICDKPYRDWIKAFCLRSISPLEWNYSQWDLEALLELNRSSRLTPNVASCDPVICLSIFRSTTLSATLHTGVSSWGTAERLLVGTGGGVGEGACCSDVSTAYSLFSNSLT